jgi:hypothetical protein
MCLLKNDTSFIWDEGAQESFDSFKKSLVSTPMLNSPNYGRDFLIYISASKGMIGTVLVKEYGNLHENIIYYLIQNLIVLELKCPHIENLALAVVHAVPRSRHYILLCKTIVIVDINQFQ